MLIDWVIITIIWKESSGDNLHPGTWSPPGSKYECSYLKIGKVSSDRGLSSLMHYEPWGSLEFVLSARPTSMTKWEHFCSNIPWIFFQSQGFCHQILVKKSLIILLVRNFRVGFVKILDFIKLFKLNRKAFYDQDYVCWVLLLQFFIILFGKLE